MQREAIGAKRSESLVATKNCIKGMLLLNNSSTWTEKGRSQATFLSEVKEICRYDKSGKNIII